MIQFTSHSYLKEPELYQFRKQSILFSIFQERLNTLGVLQKKLRFETYLPRPVGTNFRGWYVLLGNSIMKNIVNVPTSPNVPTGGYVSKRNFLCNTPQIERRVGLFSGPLDLQIFKTRAFLMLYNNCLLFWEMAPPSYHAV